MSINISNLGRSGLYDWVMQRATAIVLGLYFAAIMGFFLFSGEVTYEAWTCFIGSTPMKIATIISLLSIAAHGWIGMWTISTDYMNKDGHFPLIGELSVPTFVRMAFQGLCILILIVCVLWGTMTIWGL